MKITFFSNFINHHQLPLCKAFLERDNVEFTFVATEPIPNERKVMGYRDGFDAYILRTYESSENYEKARKLCVDCDVMIFGSAPLEYLDMRMAKNKPTFYYTERILRKGYYRRFIPTTRRKINRAYINYKDKNLYILCSSAYASYDLKLCGFNENKCFTWGYFPEVIKYDEEELFRKKQNEKVEILYAGRLIKLKRVADVIKALKKLESKGVNNFHLTIIGDGDDKPLLQKLVNKTNLSKYVTFLPFMSPEEVREYMLKSNVYVFSSNMFEGWGAVINEALNSGCAVVASHYPGAVPTLIKNGENGLIYPCANINALEGALQKVIEDKDLTLSLGKKGYETMLGWNAEVAVDRFIYMCENIDLNINVFKNGILSISKPLKNDWINKGAKL